MEGGYKEMIKNTFEMPDNWTFHNEEVAKNFDDHVRQQLPWYDLCTQMAVHIGRHYLTEYGTMYDLGASTGNITKGLKPYIETRKVKAISLDNSEQMVELWNGCGELVIADIRQYEFLPFDFCSVFLTLMFLQPEEQRNVLDSLVKKIKEGGALLIVDRCQSVGGYLGTVMTRLTLHQKLLNGAEPADILTKELSLAGVQRPIIPQRLLTRYNAVEVFRFGDFAGWVIRDE